MLSVLRYQQFVTIFWNPGGKLPIVANVLFSHKQVTYHPNSFDENCKQFQFQTDKNYYVDLRQTYLALKLKLVKGWSFEAYNTREGNKLHEGDAKKSEATEHEEAPVLLVTHVNNILHSVFSMFKCTPTFIKYTIQMDSMRTNFTFPTTSIGPSLNTREFVTAKVGVVTNFLMKLWKFLCLNFFHKENENA